MSLSSHQTSETKKLSQPQHWYGEWTALITPLKMENQALRIDAKSLERLIQSQISQGITGLVIAGSTGEGSLLTTENRHELFRLAREIAGNRIPLVGGLGIGGTRDCLSVLDELHHLGFDGALASPPAYIKATQAGLIQHYRELAQAQLPICIYEVPGRAASSISLSTLRELAGTPHLVAIKDASADLNRALIEGRDLSSTFALLTGDDGTYLPFLACGGHGVISVVTHVALKQFQTIRKNIQSGNVAEAARIQAELQPLIDLLFVESNPIPVKSLMYALKHIDHELFHSPLMPMSSQRLQDLMAAHRTII